MVGSLAHTENYLPPETTLHGRYVIDQQLDQTEDTIIYKGRDLIFGETISIIEFYPRKIAYRKADKSSKVTAAAGIQETVYTEAKDQFLRETRELLRHSNEKQGIGFIDYLEENGTVYRIMEQQHQQEVRKPQPEAKHEPGPQKPQPEPQKPQPEPQKPQPEPQKPQPKPQSEAEPEPQKPQLQPQPPQEKTHTEPQSESDLAALKRARLEAYKRKMEELRNKKHAGQSNENTGLKENKEEPEQEAVNHESVNNEPVNNEPVNNEPVKNESLNHEFDPQQLSAIDRFFYNSIIWLMLKLGTKKQAREIKKVTLQNFFKKPAFTKFSIVICMIIGIMIILQFPILTFIIVIYFLLNVWLSREK